VKCFDSLAASYDRGFGLSPAGRLFRFRVAERVMSAAPPGARVLDIGCGTGEDAIWLAAQGYAALVRAPGNERDYLAVVDDALAVRGKQGQAERKGK